MDVYLGRWINLDKTAVFFKQQQNRVFPVASTLRTILQPTPFVILLYYIMYSPALVAPVWKVKTNDYVTFSRDTACVY